jgi:hypothetical protein
MRHFLFVRALVVTVLLQLLPAAPVLAQGSPARPEPTLRDALSEQWESIAQKLIVMAEDFPEAKYDYRPAPDVRTFADQLRHVAFWHQFVAKTLKGETFDAKPNELSKTEFATKASIVAALKSSTAEATAALKQQPAMPAIKVAGLANTFTEHSGEHYGQLVVYYRLNGIVPPESRPKK